MPTVYNTGKVQIGICYIAPPMPVNTIDELHLQSALLKPHTGNRKSFFKMVLARFMPGSDAKQISCCIYKKALYWQHWQHRQQQN